MFVHMLRTTSAAIASALFIGFILYYAGGLPLAIFRTWVIAVVGYSLLRMVHMLIVKYYKLWQKQPRLHLGISIVLTLISGGLWGYGYWHFSFLVPTEVSVLLIIVIIALTAGSVTTMSGSFLNYYALLFTSVLSIALRNFIYPATVVELITGIAATIYTFFMIVTHSINHQMLLDTIKSVIKQNQYLASLTELNEKLKIASSTDSLTGIPNRRYFNERSIAVWQQSKNKKLSVALMIIDVDYYKQYNDSIGHLAGDECLVTVAKVIKEALRHDADLVARYGGDEFVILLVDCDATGAMTLAQRINKAVYDSHIKNPGSPVSDYVTVTIGVATTVPSDNEVFRTLIQQADTALYQAKEKGRNNCQLYIEKKAGS